MTQIPDYEEFQRLANDVALIREENEFLRSLLLAQRSLSRKQVLKALNVSETTLWRITKSGRIASFEQDGKTYYDIDSVRSYLTGQKLTRKSADNRIIQACYGA